MKPAFVIAGIVLFLLGCINHKFKEADFVGTWQAVDGARIIFNQDSTCVLSKLNKSIATFASDPNERINAKGKWEVIDNAESGITGGTTTGIRISYDLGDRKAKGEFVFFIAGEGLHGNQPPWHLFIWEGDPDELKEYKFVKH